ncbi:MAG: hypothetical protein Q9210_007171 [Variospora velana]
MIEADTLAQLDCSLQGGRLVISALEEDLLPFTVPSLLTNGNPVSSGFRRKLKVVWNEQALRDHQERIRDQVNSMNLFINVLQMPTCAIRRQSLSENLQIIRKSDESAYTIVPSRVSIISRSLLTHENGSLHSLESDKSLVYHELSVDDELFKSRVYKRNYRNRVIEKALRRDKSAPRNTFKVINHRSTDEDTDDRVLTTKESYSMSSPLLIGEKPMVDAAPGATCSLSERHRTYWFVGEDAWPLRGWWIPGPKVSAGFDPAGGPARGGQFLGRAYDLTSKLAVDRIDFKRTFEDAKEVSTEFLHHCLMTACRMGNKNLLLLVLDLGFWTCSMLLRQGCSGYAYPFPLDLAFHNGHLEIVKRILMQDLGIHALPTSMGPQMVYRAVCDHNHHLLALLIKQVVVDLRFRYDLGRQASHIACQKKSLKCLAVLIAEGADLEALDETGNKALHYLEPKIRATFLSVHGTREDGPLREAIPTEEFDEFDESAGGRPNSGIIVTQSRQIDYSTLDDLILGDNIGTESLLIDVREYEDKLRPKNDHQRGEQKALTSPR